MSNRIWLTHLERVCKPSPGELMGRARALFAQKENNVGRVCRHALVCLALLVIAIGCAPAPTPTPAPPTATPPSAPVTSSPAAFPVTITDDAGRQVTVKAAPLRVVSLAPSNTETIYALGRGASVVGVTEYCDYPPEAKNKPKVGGYSKIDLEKVIGLSPDLVLATSIHAKSIVPELEKRGLTVAVVEPKTVDEVLAKLVTTGKLLGANEEARLLQQQLKARVDAVTAQVANLQKKPRVFYEIDKTLYTPGPGSFLDDLLVKAGATNIAADAKGAYAQLTAEAVIARDPEVILLGDMFYGETPDEVRKRPGWNNITAVKTGRIVPIAEENLVSRPGPRVVEGLELIARALYPEVFK